MLYYYPNRPLLLPPDHEKVDQFSNDVNWDAEIKLNGDRLVLRKINKQFEFWNRDKRIFKRYEPPASLIDELQQLQLPDNTQLDGELMHFKIRSIKNKIFFYDIYIVDNQKIMSNLEERRQILHNFWNKRKFQHLHISSVYDTGFKKIFLEVIKKEENEGLVMKDKRGKIVWNVVKSPDVPWQVKIRRPHKNYQF